MPDRRRGHKHEVRDPWFTEGPVTSRAWPDELTLRQVTPVGPHAVRMCTEAHAVRLEIPM